MHTVGRQLGVRGSMGKDPEETCLAWVWRTGSWNPTCMKGNEVGWRQRWDPEGRVARLRSSDLSLGQWGAMEGFWAGD